MNDEVADVANRIGAELSEAATEAFEAFCIANHETPPTKRERLLIRVMSLQLASSIANILASE